MPPYTAWILNGVKRPSWCASASICTTSSRVGAMTSTRGAAAPPGVARSGVRSRRVKAAIKNAAVFPVPVCDWPATSLPLRASGSVASWIGVAATKPTSRMPCMTGSGRFSVAKSIALGRCLLGDGHRFGLAPENASTDDPHLVEDDEGPRHQRLVERVRRRRQHGARDEGAQDRVLAVLGQHLCGDEAHAGGQRERQRKLEDETEGERELQEEVDVAAHRDHRLQPGSRVGEQELDGVGSDHVERKGAAQHEQEGADYDERHGVLLFVMIEARRDETPHLPEDARRGDEESGDERDLHLD